MLAKQGIAVNNERESDFKTEFNAMLIRHGVYSV